MMKSMLVVFFGLAMAFSGCATTPQAPVAQLATQYAVMKWIAREGDDVARVHRVLAIADALELDPAVVLAEALKSTVMQRVAGLDPADQMLAGGLVDLLVPYLDTRDQVPVALSDIALLLRKAAFYYTG